MRRKSSPNDNHRLKSLRDLFSKVRDKRISITAALRAGRQVCRDELLAGKQLPGMPLHLDHARSLGTGSPRSPS